MKKLIEGIPNYFYYKNIKTAKIETPLLNKLINDNSYFNDIESINRLSKRMNFKDYNTESHPYDIKGITKSIENGLIENKRRLENNEKRKLQAEKFYCRYFLIDYPHSFPGKPVDYEVTLKTPKEDNKGIGDIDLLAKSDSTAILFEVKRPDNSERPLRAILEAYTYWKQVGGNNASHFLETSAAFGSNTLEKAVMIYYNPKSSIYRSFKIGWDKYYRLIMKKLQVNLYLALTCGNKESVKDFKTSNIVEVENSFEEAEQSLLK